MPSKVLKVHPSDNVVVALATLQPGETLSFQGTTYTFTQQIPAKHKFAAEDLPEGAAVMMYGVLVGHTTELVRQGECLTVQNLRHSADTFSPVRRKHPEWVAPDVSRWKNRTFMGYHRADGRVGTANYWIFVPMVFCENRNLDVIREALVKELGYAGETPYQVQSRKLVNLYQQGRTGAELLAEEWVLEEEPSRQRVFPNIDGIKFLRHDGGCGGTRHDAETLCNLLAGYICHPNVAGATVLSLGCQHAQFSLLEAAIERIDPARSKPVLFFEQQQVGSEQKLLSMAISQTFAALTQANQLSRQPAPLSKLVLGMECGGSDGFSGISANPAMGYAADLVVALGGTVILSEFPELCGVEQELIDRCTDGQTAQKFYDIQTAYARAAAAVGAGFDMNPSPGNIKDGLITDAIKSAGAAKKGGTSPVTDVLDYTEQALRPGLSLLCTPGNDVESTTGLAGSGANLILFSTGLGTPTGNPVTPVIKVATNSALAKRMPDIIDIDTGPIIFGEETIESMGEKILEYCIQVASGEQIPCAVALGQDDFIPWKRGVSL